jgi:hypothetical protein
MRTNGVSSRCKPHGLAFVPLLILPLVTGLVPVCHNLEACAAAPPEPTQMPISAAEGPSDRLAEPVLPESPTQVDFGRSLYYFHCMPCHGDRGQGLTDEWRQVWVEDHQNCWGRGCHTGRELAAFPIPRFIPPVTGSAWALSRFQTADELFSFLRETQPPQRPGALSDDEYWKLTAYLLYENGRQPKGVELGRGEPVQPAPRGDILAVAIFGPMLVMLGISGAARRKGQPSDGSGLEAGPDCYRG